MWKMRLKEEINENTMQQKLSREFFVRDGLIVARELLGKILVHETSLGTVRGVITEVESYMGIHDKGSHTYQGRRTERTEPMFHQGGTSYVYFTYGMYYCMNIATGSEGDPQAVLIRSVVPADEVSGQRMLELRMQRVRQQLEKKGTPDIDNVLRKKEKAVWKNLADGPGKMCIAMEMSKADNDVDMINSETFYVTEGIPILPEEICKGKRIGIDYAQEAAEYLWRFDIS